MGPKWRQMCCTASGIPAPHSPCTQHRGCLPVQVHRVYYYWALQQQSQGYVAVDGSYQPPRWELREMLIRGMHHLL
jgi:hypothetical protein